MNYTELINAAKSYADRQDIEVDNSIDTFIMMAEARINRILKVYGQAHRIYTTTIENQEYYSLPPDYNGMRAIQFNSGKVDEPGSKTSPMHYASPEQMALLQNEGRPSDHSFYCISGEQIQVYPTLSGDGTIEMVFYRKVPNINSTNSTNWLSENNPDIYLSGIIAEIEQFVKSYDVSDRWDAKMSRAISEMTSNDVDQRWSGSQLTTRIMP